MKLAVLNPGGNDRDQTFPDFAGAVADRIHAPVNYHSYAACTGGSFHRKISNIADDQKNVLLLLRHDLALCFKTLQQLKDAGKTVAVSLKESGAFQFAELFQDAAKIGLFQKICALAHGCLASTPDLIAVYEAAGGRRVEFIATPYPVDDPRWNFSVPLEKRDGIFIGTREFKIPSRNHLAALLVAKQLGEKITVINTEGRTGLRLHSAIGNRQSAILSGPLPYSEYLRLMAQHKLVFQLDRSGVPGQVAGDALLCRVPCVGGDGAIEKIAFPSLSGHGRTTSELRAQAETIIANPIVSECQQVSFAVIAAKLSNWFGSLR